MRHLHKTLAAILVGAALLAGCSPKEPPKPTQQETNNVPKRPELIKPIEDSLIALREMNEAGKNKDIPGALVKFQNFRTAWAGVKPELEKEDPKLAVHIEDGAVELDHEFKKTPEEFRFYELDEETVKLGRLLSSAAELLGAEIRAELVQKDPTLDIPFNKEKRIEITMIDHKFEPANITVEQHTKVTFVLVNRGKYVHEFELGHYAVELEEVFPGETKEITVVTLDAGEFELACHYPGHYEVGMHGTLKVTPAELKQK
ncbi:MAG TPA: cupredoxin domain-containing protein [Symbiobacteriaceae bacterium]|jgi:plastocyanin|nr:cupredoxin domain-containing protein [Symbiobacteriaceae bacterium]